MPNNTLKQGPKIENVSPSKGHVPSFWKQFINNPKSMSSENITVPRSPTSLSRNAQPTTLKRPPLSSRPYSYNTPTKDRNPFPNPRNRTITITTLIPEHRLTQSSKITEICFYLIEMVSQVGFSVLL